MNKNVSSIRPFLVLMVTVLGVSCRERGASPESVVLNNVAIAITLHCETNNGQPPLDWKSIEQHVSLEKLNTQYLVSSSLNPIQSHFLFVTNRLPALYPEKGHVVLLQSHPRNSPEGAGRYLVFWNGQQSKVSWMPESEVQKMLLYAKTPHPAPAETGSVQ
jgi:hypothetical protein